MKEEEENRLNRKRFLVNCRAAVAKVAKAASIDVFTAIGLAALNPLAVRCKRVSTRLKRCSNYACVCVCVNGCVYLCVYLIFLATFTLVSLCVCLLTKLSSRSPAKTDTLYSECCSVLFAISNSWPKPARFVCPLQLFAHT